MKPQTKKTKSLEESAHSASTSKVEGFGVRRRSILRPSSTALKSKKTKGGKGKKKKVRFDLVVQFSPPQNSFNRTKREKKRLASPYINWSGKHYLKSQSEADFGSQNRIVQVPYTFKGKSFTCLKSARAVTGLQKIASPKVSLQASHLLPPAETNSNLKLAFPFPFNNSAVEPPSIQGLENTASQQHLGPLSPTPKSKTFTEKIQGSDLKTDGIFTNIPPPENSTHFGQFMWAQPLQAATLVNSKTLLYEELSSSIESLKISGKGLNQSKISNHLLMQTDLDPSGSHWEMAKDSKEPITKSVQQECMNSPTENIESNGIVEMGTNKSFKDTDRGASNESNNNSADKSKNTQTNKAESVVNSDLANLESETSVCNDTCGRNCNCTDTDSQVCGTSTQNHNEISEITQHSALAPFSKITSSNFSSKILSKLASNHESDRCDNCPETIARCVSIASCEISRAETPEIISEIDKLLFSETVLQKVKSTNKFEEEKNQPYNDIRISTSELCNETENQCDDTGALTFREGDGGGLETNSHPNFELQDNPSNVSTCIYEHSNQQHDVHLVLEDELSQDYPIINDKKNFNGDECVCTENVESNPNPCPKLILASEDTASSEEDDESDIFYICPVLNCGQTFTLEPLIQAHMASRDHSPCNPMATIINSMVPSKVSHLCPVCGQIFQKEGDCCQHMLEARHGYGVATPVPFSVYACPCCLGFFPSLSRALRHMADLGHHQSALEFQGDNKTPNEVRPVPVPHRVMLELLSVCKQTPFSIVCQNCCIGLETSADIQSHLARAHTVSSKCCKTVVDVLSSLVTDQACAECRQFIYRGMPESSLCIHMNCPSKAPVLSLPATTLREFLLRCGIAGIAVGSENNLEDLSESNTSSKMSIHPSEEDSLMTNDTIKYLDAMTEDFSGYNSDATKCFSPSSRHSYNDVTENKALHAPFQEAMEYSLSAVGGSEASHKANNSFLVGNANDDRYPCTTDTCEDTTENHSISFADHPLRHLSSDDPLCFSEPPSYFVKAKQAPAEEPSPLADETAHMRSLTNSASTDIERNIHKLPVSPSIKAAEGRIGNESTTLSDDACKACNSCDLEHFDDMSSRMNQSFEVNKKFEENQSHIMDSNRLVISNCVENILKERGLLIDQSTQTTLSDWNAGPSVQAKQTGAKSINKNTNQSKNQRRKQATISKLHRKSPASTVDRRQCGQKRKLTHGSKEPSHKRRKCEHGKEKTFRKKAKRIPSSYFVIKANDKTWSQRYDRNRQPSRQRSLYFINANKDCKCKQENIKVNFKRSFQPKPCCSSALSDESLSQSRFAITAFTTSRTAASPSKDDNLTSLSKESLYALEEHSGSSETEINAASNRLNQRKPSHVHLSSSSASSGLNSVDSSESLYVLTKRPHIESVQEVHNDASFHNNKSNIATSRQDANYESTEETSSKKQGSGLDSVKLRSTECDIIEIDDINDRFVLINHSECSLYQPDSKLSTEDKIKQGMCRAWSTLPEQNDNIKNLKRNGVQKESLHSNYTFSQKTKMAPVHKKRGKGIRNRTQYQRAKRTRKHKHFGGKHKRLKSFLLKRRGDQRTKNKQKPEFKIRFEQVRFKLVPQGRGNDNFANPPLRREFQDLSANRSQPAQDSNSPRIIQSMMLSLDGPRCRSLTPPFSAVAGHVNQKQSAASSSTTSLSKAVQFKKLVSPKIHQLITMNSIVFADLENFMLFKYTQGSFLPRTYVWGFISARSNSRFQREDFFYKFPLYQRLKSDNCCHISTEIGTSKDAVDFAMTMAIAKLDDRLPYSIPFYIVSNDKGFLEVENQLKRSARKVKVVTPRRNSLTASDFSEDCILSR